MMKNIYLSLWALLLSAPVWGQGNLRVESANIRIANGTEFRVEDSQVHNVATGQIQNEGNFYLDLNYNQDASANYLGSGWLWFEGNANQNIIAGSPFTIDRLRVDNGQRLILQNSLFIGQELDLSLNGSLELGSHDIELLPGAIPNNYDLNNYVVTNGTGRLLQEVGAAALVFPVGNSQYNPATLSNSGTTDVIAIRLEDVVLDRYPIGTPETEGAVFRTWQIEERTAGGSSVTMTLEWEQGQELPNFDRNQSGISHWRSTYWDRSPSWTAATPLGGNRYTQSRSGITSFSPFAVEDYKMDLPIEWLSFEAQRNSADWVQLDWATASEENNQGFELERMLEGESDFSPIAWVDGQGNSQQRTDYQYMDQNDFSGISYYRIKQLDQDGQFSYSLIRAVSGQAKLGNLALFPNPTSQDLFIRLDRIEDQKANLRLYAANGQVVLEKTAFLENNYLLQLNDLPAGAYLLQIQLEDGRSFTRKLTKL